MTAVVRCKFAVNRVTDCRFEGYIQSTVRMGPVYSDDENSTNKKFWDSTPSGLLELTVTNNSLDRLVPGDEYYVDLIPAVKQGS